MDGPTFTAHIERIAAGGAGIAHVEGKAVFVEFTAPGERIRGSITREHKTWAEGELLEILEPSPDRKAPECPLYGRCGGCSLQHLAYEAQVAAKAAILAAALVRIGGIEAPESRIRRSPPFEYRNRMRFHTNGQVLGLKERKSSRIVPLADCPIADPGIRTALGEAGGQVPGGNAARGPLKPLGKLRPPPGKPSFTVYSRGGLFLSEGGQKQGCLSLGGRELVMDAGVFFQSNAALLETLLEDLAAAAAGADRNLPLADVYSGVGTFAAFLGAGFQALTLVEADKTALALARRNMPAGRKGKVQYHALSDSAWAAQAQGPWGFMVLDPPRDGLGGPLRKYLAQEGPPLVAYVSCNPATLARDSRFLADGGYTLKELTFYDFYPQTAHIESLALFSRERRSSP